MVAVADDVAHTVTDGDPRQAIHNLQLLLNITEVHGHQLHMEFGISKCKLLISGRPKKVKETEKILNDDPGLLTFFGNPVSIVSDFYTHIGVPQAPRQQSKVITDCRISAGMKISYSLQDSMKNAARGLSPLSGRKMFLSYHQPSFLYGTDTVPLNLTDMARLETAYRGVIKKMLAIPEYTASCAVYLTSGIFPAEAQRDLEILGLLGQIAMCPVDLQSVSEIIKHHLQFYGEDCPGWSGLVRRTAQKYGLPDPLQYMEYPWPADRWRAHCRDTVAQYWDSKLREEADMKSTLTHLDIESLTVKQPAKIWSMAGLDSEEVKKATINNWMLLGVYQTNVVMKKMKKVKSEMCMACNGEQEDLAHLVFHCPPFQEVRERYLPLYHLDNPHLTEVMEDEQLLLTAILDPESSLLPLSVMRGWTSSNKIYKISRDYLYNLHRKREKVLQNLHIS